MLLDGTAPEGLGDHPWDFRPPIVLSTTASLDLGYEPVAHDPFFGHFLDYRLEDTIANP